MKSLQEIRKESNYTQEDVSAYLGISQQAYANYEKDDVNVPLKILEKLSSLFMCDLSDFTYIDQLENDSITEFLYKSLTSYHAVKNSVQILKENGFIELNEDKVWKLEKGGKYYLTKNGSALIAFKVGDLSSYQFHIASCHTDSPSLKVKGKYLLDSCEGKKINVEKYGGLINYSFMNIPLKIAGRVIYKENDQLISDVYSSNFNVNIPSLCIHHNIDVNDGVKLDYQNDMLPLLGKFDGDLYSKLFPKKEVLDADLYCVPFVKPTFAGVAKEHLVSPRIDNLSSLYSILQALLNSKDTKGISILYASDNEEIGSLSKQGAESAFLKNVLAKINKDLGKKEEDYNSAINNGFILSIDNGHAVHQAHPEKYDPANKVYLNKGIVIKHHTNYSTDGVSSSIVKYLASINNIEVQEYYNNSNIRCGGTIGLIASAQLAMNAADIGLAQLAMHSAIETVGKHDIKKMENLVKTFFEVKIPEIK